MNQGPDRGGCFPEDVNKIEEQSFIGSCDTDHGISSQSIAMLGVNSVEGGAGLVNCDVDIPENDDSSLMNEDFDKNVITYERRKRQKKTELSDIPTTNLGFPRQDTGSSLLVTDQIIGSTSLDRPFGFEFVSPCSSESRSEKRVIAEDVISSEVDETKSLEEAVACSLGFQRTSSSNYDKAVIGESDDTNENHNVDMLAPTLPKSSAGNDRALDMVSTETDIGEVKETDSIVEVNKLKFEEENITNDPRLPSGDALSGDTPLYHEKQQSVTSEVDVSSKLLDGSKGVVSQDAHDESKNVSVDRTFAGYTGKKLLVLDVNGLLLDISTYIPYDYDPDEIILKKAVFKRPHCDDFLKFCFEKFNVGVWTSRTKNNIAPILDFLLGSEKHKLLFCWDQSQCTNTGFTTVEKRHKPLLLKKLKKLWNKADPDLPWERGVYNESNTLLLDDTPYKALSNPRYTAVFPYTYRFRDVGDNSLGPGGDLRVYLEGLAVAENVQEYIKQNPFGQRQITEKNLSWGYYRKVIEASSTPPRNTDDEEDTLGTD